MVIPEELRETLYISKVEVTLRKISHKAYQYARRELGDFRAPYAITLAGSTVYIITDPRHVNDVYNKGTSYSFDTFLRDIMTGFGTSPQGVKKILQQKPVRNPTERLTEKSSSVSQIAHDLQVRQTQGNDLKVLGAYISDIFLQSLSPESVGKGDAISSVFLQKDNCHILSLKKWTAEIFIDAGQKAYFGEELSKINPHLPQALIKFDDLSWQVFYQYPACLRRQLNQVSAEILDSLRRYLGMPAAKRKGKAWFTTALEEEYRTAGLSNEDIACQMLFLYWGINTNISKVGFWIIANILFTPGLAESVEQETRPAFRPDGSFDSDYASSSCPRLESLWLETLRQSATSTTVRTVTSNTAVGGKLLEKGKKLLISARQLHFSSSHFGDNASEFDPLRFIKNPSLHRSPAFRPFGGGGTQCPGRFLAKHMVLNFVSLLFHQYNVSLAGPQAFPRYEESKPAIGITSGEGDLHIRLKERALGSTAGVAR